MNGWLDEAVAALRQYDLKSELILVANPAHEHSSARRWWHVIAWRDRCCGGGQYWEERVICEVCGFEYWRIPLGDDFAFRRENIQWYGEALTLLSEQIRADIDRVSEAWRARADELITRRLD
jgi:hypothetical protein